MSAKADANAATASGGLRGSFGGFVLCLPGTTSFPELLVPIYFRLPRTSGTGSGCIEKKMLLPLLVFNTFARITSHDI